MTNLGIALAAFQQKLDLEGRELASEIGLHQSTISRMKQGLLPDADGLVKIMTWLLAKR